MIAVVVIALALLGAAIAGSYASMNSAQEQHYQYDDFKTGSVGSQTNLTGATEPGVYYSNKTVSADGNIGLDAGEDYIIHPNGTFEVLSSDAADTNVTVGYTYHEQNRQQRAVSGVVASIIDAGAYLPLVFVVLLVVAVIGAMGVFN